MPTNISLYQAEDYLAALYDTQEGGISEDQQQEFQIELASALNATTDKRESVGQFILAVEARAEFKRAESRRNAESARIDENVAKRVREYVRDWICQQPKDAKGKLPKLQGRTLAMSTRACPASLEITDPVAIPAQFLNINISMPLTVWTKLLEASGGYAPSELGSIDRTVSVDKSALKKAIEGGAEIPGADLICDKSSLVIK